MKKDNTTSPNKQDISGFLSTLFADIKPLKEELNRLQENANRKALEKAHARGDRQRNYVNVYSFSIEGYEPIEHAYNDHLSKLEASDISAAHLEVLQEHRMLLQERLEQLKHLQTDSENDLSDVKLQIEESRNSLKDHSKLLAAGDFDGAEQLNSKCTKLINQLNDQCANLETKISSYLEASQLIEFDIALYDEIEKKIAQTLSIQLYHQKEKEFTASLEQLKTLYLECDALAQELNLERKQHQQISDLLGMENTLRHQFTAGVLSSNVLRKKELSWDKKAF